MNTLSEKALAIRLATIKANTEIHDAILKETIDYALRPEALELLEEEILASASGSLVPAVSCSIIIDLTRISQLGPFELCHNSWVVSFPFRDMLLDMHVSEFYREHPFVQAAMTRLREFCGPAAQIDRPYVSKTAVGYYGIVIGIHIALPRQISQ